MTVAVVTDSTSDIPPELAQDLGIHVIPALLMMDGQTYRDGHDLSRGQFYERLPKLRSFPTTAVPSPLAFHDAYEACLSSGFSRILSIHLSHKLSGMFDLARQAASEFRERVTVFDSGMVSLGLGFQVLEIAAAARQGVGMRELLERLRMLKPKARVIAMLDTQEYLRRSGRVSWVKAGLGKMLRIRLLVEVVDGQVERRDLIRTRRKAIDALTQMVRSWGPLHRLALLHTAAAEEAAALAESLASLSTSPPLVVEATTLLGAHVGPAALGAAALLP